MKFHKEKIAVTFHTISYDDVVASIDFSRFPRSNVSTLLAIEDLGRGSTGKAWLCATITKPRSSVCVLKFDNKQISSINLDFEKEMWHLLYPEFACMVKVELWSGSCALLMPHFSAILENERDDYREDILELLHSKFQRKLKVHNDVRWSNIGKYMSTDGEESVVIFDLLSVRDYDSENELHQNWVEKALSSLYG
jgi:hypothetical protein